MWVTCGRCPSLIFFFLKSQKRFLTMKSHQSAVRVLAFGESLQMLFSGQYPYRRVLVVLLFFYGLLACASSTGGDDGFVLGWNMEPLLGNAVGAGAAGSKCVGIPAMSPHLPCSLLDFLTISIFPLSHRKVSPKFNMTVHQDVPITGVGLCLLWSFHSC